jgi:hypothetical protein
VAAAKIKQDQGSGSNPTTRAHRPGARTFFNVLGGQNDYKKQLHRFLGRQLKINMIV